MPERYVDAILKYLTSRDYQPLKPRQLARQMGVSEGDYGSFREAVKRLRDGGRIVLGARNALTLPEMSSRVTGTFRLNPRGFGFIVPETPNAHGDLFVAPPDTAGALSGDTVVANVKKRGRRDGEIAYGGVIVQIVRRGENRFVGTLQKADVHWFVMPDGARMPVPIIVRDISAAGPAAGSKVIVEIIRYPSPGELPVGVIVETLGGSGKIEAETLSVIRAHGLADEFPDDVLDETRRVVETFDPTASGVRKDLTDLLVVTIDPPDARDYDDAISLTSDGKGKLTLGVHIADVSNFVTEGGPIDTEARSRGTSAYFPRKVVPMLPEALSNGICSLQEAQPRFVKSAFITYDESANVVSTRLAEAVIRSSKRLTYLQAQSILDGKTSGFDKKVVKLLRNLQGLARRIETRRRKAGMLHLDLPAVELVFDDAQRVVDAVPEDDSYTHTMIEMFMVEANEAVARTLAERNRKFLRRVHPEPDPMGAKQMISFIRACGHRLPKEISREALQELLEAVRGKPESYAVNLAVLKTFRQAEYSPMQIGHFALASDCYCHFTSPIRRYPDLTVHRLVALHCRGELDNLPPDDVSELTRLGENCTAAEKRAEAAEQELREVLILQLLESKVGETFEGVITGVTNFGMFVQSPQFLIEGLLRMEDLGDDWWELDAKHGTLRGEHTGRKFRIGDVLSVRIAGVDVSKRQLNLALDKNAQTARKKKKKAPRSKKPKRPRTKGK